MRPVLLNIYNIIIVLMYFVIKAFGQNKSQIKNWIQSRKMQYQDLHHWNLHNPSKRILFHCASLGEFEQGYPIIKRIKNKYPQYKIIVSFFSPSGYENVHHPELIDLKIYSPLDTKIQVKKHLELLNPMIAIFIKNEFWPNYILGLVQKNIPVFFTSTHITKDSYYPGFFYNIIFQSVDYFFVQTIETQEFLQKRGMKKISVTGDFRILKATANVKVHYTNKDLDKIKKPLIVYGSVWKEDWKIIKQFIYNTDGYIHVIAPHNLSEENVTYFKNEIANIKHTILLDVMGELKYVYRYAKIAYVGGAFGRGLHNILEPTAYKIPVIFGPKYHKFNEAVKMVEMGAALSIQSSEDCIKAFNQIISSKSTFEEKVAKFYDYYSPNINIVINHIEKHIL